MKKLLTLITLLTIVACAGCTPKEAVENSTKEVTYNFQKEPEAELIRAEYIKAVKKRNNSEEFFSEEEIAFLEAEGYKVGNKMIAFYDEWYEEPLNYYFPILWTSQKEETKIAYISAFGEIEVKTLKNGGGSEWHDNVHTESENIIVKNTSFSITFDDKTGEIQLWSWGEEKEKYTVPVGSVYVGFSEFEGYIFRHNTDVYALKTGETYMVNEATQGVQVIAHNVKQVIDADYYLSSDPWCQPLFLMTDGTVKAYVGWEGDQEDPDSNTHLVDIRHEGGYDK